MAKFLPFARRLGRVQGRNAYRFVVIVSQSYLDYTLVEDRLHVEIIATSAAEACNTILAEFAPMVEKPTTFETRGTKGGVTRRWVGWDGLIGAKMWRGHPDHDQLELRLPPPLPGGDR